MSTLLSSTMQAARRLSRPDDASPVRARLSVVPARSTTAARAPFVALIVVLLVGGVIGLLVFNTHMQQSAFRATALQERADALTARQQGLAMDLQQLRDPQQLAQRARRLGMVAPQNPAFIQLGSGRVLGDPTKSAPGADGIRIQPFPVAPPRGLLLKPRIIRVPLPAQRASAAVPGPAGKKKVDHSALR